MPKKAFAILSLLTLTCGAAYTLNAPFPWPWEVWEVKG